MGHSIQSLVPFGQLYDLIKKTYFWIYLSTNFFQRQTIAKIPFVLHSRYTWDNIYMFGSISRSFWPYEKDLFLKFLTPVIRNFPYEKLTFFLRKLLQKLFSFYTLDTHDLLHTKFGSPWTTLWPNRKT